MSEDGCLARLGVALSMVKIRQVAKNLVTAAENVVRKEIVNVGIRLRGQRSSDYILRRIEWSEPFLAARLGTGELNTIKKIRLLRKGRGRYSDQDHSGLEKIAGFFPLNQSNIERFYDRMVGDLPEVDLLGSWLVDERFFAPELAQAKRCRLEDLEPYYHANPWSAALAGKKVLVVHPFEASIRHQYAHRQALFGDSRVLPEFELITYKSVQSLGTSHDRGRFATWFEALASMEDGVAKLDFDIALVGCGAYGLPLAAHIKRLGKKAIHLGGATQILFGIRGTRWESQPAVARLFNDAWIRPDEEERPNNFKEIEGGSYW